jgi:branched-chain amino acid transport system permease protein
VVSARALAVVAAALWPFVLGNAAAHRLGVQVLAAALLGLSLTVTVGWLRVVSLFQPAAAAAGAYATARLLAAGQALPFAVLAAALAGALAGLVALAPARARPRVGLPLTSLLLTVAVWAAVVPAVRALPFVREPFVGIDLAGDRALYLLVLAGVVGVLVGLDNLTRSAVGRGLVALGAGGDLAARSGVSPTDAWREGVALSGALAGLSGCVAALVAQGIPPASAFSPAVAVSALAIPLLGGAPWPAGALVGAGLLTVVTPLAARVGLGAVALSGAALVVAVLALPDGIVGRLRAAQQPPARAQPAGRRR